MRVRTSFFISQLLYFLNTSRTLACNNELWLLENGVEFKQNDTLAKVVISSKSGIIPRVLFFKCAKIWAKNDSLQPFEASPRLIAKWNKQGSSPGLINFCCVLS